MEHFLLQYGALGVFLGAAFEGQTAVIIGGLLARQHLMPLWVAVGSATAGSAILDHLLFVAGRRFRSSKLVMRMAAKPAFTKSLSFIERFPVSFILAFRFIYGLRAAGPVAIGISKNSALVFTLLNIVSALIWASAFTMLGFLFGHAFEEAIGQGTSKLQRTIFTVVVLVIAVAAFAVIRWIVGRQRAKAAAASPVATPGGLETEGREPPLGVQTPEEG